MSPRLYPIVLAAFCGLVLSVTPAGAAATASDRQILQVLDRLAFGASPEDFRHVKEVGVERYIKDQLDPQSIPERAELVERLKALDTLALGPVELFLAYGPPLPAGGVKPTPEERKARQVKSRIIVQQAAQARVLRALYSRRQLNEVMVDFWYNHFNVFAAKGLDHLWVGAYEEEAIRPHALGRFRDLLLATARHPAMLFYLDNFQNSAPGSPPAYGLDKGGINENYARELMELHTLGVDGGYTQEDVIELARILTGWGLAGPKMPSSDGFLFNLARHDFGPKHLLGQDIKASGEGEVLEALDILAKSPATARHIAYELAQYFVADNPPPALVDRLAARFTASDGDIRATLETLFQSPEFRASLGTKYKTPYRFVVSAVRAAGLPVKNPRPLLGTMARLGMPLYGCETPDGYAAKAAAWISPDAMTVRVSFATALAQGDLPLAVPPPADPPDAAKANAAPALPVAFTHEPVDAAALAGLLDPLLSPKARTVIAAAPPVWRAALILGSPDFMRE